MQAYIGIHQPKNINEADLARKRLIFDEFFYLQVTFIHNIMLIIVDFSSYFWVCNSISSYRSLLLLCNQFLICLWLGTHSSFYWFIFKSDAHQISYSNIFFTSIVVLPVEPPHSILTPSNCSMVLHAQCTQLIIMSLFLCFCNALVFLYG